MQKQVGLDLDELNVLQALVRAEMSATDELQRKWRGEGRNESAERAVNDYKWLESLLAKLVNPI